MKYNYKKEAYLVLEDGYVAKGTAVGKTGTSGGEICFNTGMTGYQEVYTDPSYYGQVIVNTTPHIGNYGVLGDEQESDKPKIAGVVIGKFSDIFSRKTGESTLQKYFEDSGIVGIADIDTRAVVRHIRSKGAMNCIISSEINDIDELKAKLKDIPNMEGLELSSKVSTAEPYFIGDEKSDIRVAVLDLGIKLGILKNLASRGVYCKVFPHDTSYEDMAAWNPDGFFISNGPGDPASTEMAIKTVKKILDEDKIMFGICLGHQILALASGVSTFKMHHGHRGLNHPVKNLATGKSEITTQNHGFCVKQEDIDKVDNVEVTHVHLNDQTVQGIKRTDKKAFSVQYHPEACPGPHDSRYLFDDFIKLMKN